MALRDLFPYPKSVTESGMAIDIDQRSLELDLPESGEELLSSARAVLDVCWNGRGRAYPVTVTLGALTIPAEGLLREEAYALSLGGESGSIRAEHPRGVFLAAQTLATLVRTGNGTLPEVEIIDWPDLAWRGLYIESKWGPDLMTLADWRAAIDDLASKKFNSLGIGVYGCWGVQYGGKITEFLLLPFPNYPDLKSEKTLRYYSPAANAWQTLTYVPKMVEEDSFGEIVAYARSRNIRVRPHFNGPGHNTILPRYFPEMSAVDAAGNPKGYGYSLTSEGLYERLFELYDSVIDRYLKPNGIDWFHMGLDEVWPTNVDETDIGRQVDPWCARDLATGKSRGELLQDYVIRVATHLKRRGITNITLWNDELEKDGALTPEFGQRLADAGLSDNVVIQWWRYNPPVLTPKPEIGVRAWSTPMTGYWSNLFTQSYTANIWDMVAHGVEHGIEGADAYCIYDPAYDRNLALLSQVTWNTDGKEDLFAFKSRYARALLEDIVGPHDAAKAFGDFEEAFGSPDIGMYATGWLLYYWHTYAHLRVTQTYPQNVMHDLLGMHPRLSTLFGASARIAAEAGKIFDRAWQQSSDPLLGELAAECDKLQGVWQTWTHGLAAARAYEKGDTDAALSSLDAARARLVAVMARLESIKQPYLLPQILRDLSILLRYIERIGDDVRSAVAAGGALPAFAALPTNGLDLDVEVSTAFDPPIDIAARA